MKGVYQAEMTQADEHKTTPIFCAMGNILNEHVLKEYGLLSWGMHEYYGFDSILATYENESYPNLKYIPGVRMEFIPHRTGKFILDSCLWLMQNARRINVLFMMHPIMRSFMQAFTYKILNPKGKIYLKFDGDYMRHGRGNFWKRLCYNWLVSHSACVSTELEGNAEILSREWGRKIIWIPNPANPSELGEYRPFSQRSNVIFTAGRLGTKQKATEILLHAFAKIADKIPSWTLKLAGRFEENMNIASDFYAEYPTLKGRVIFMGEIRDRAELIETYRDAKIFAFPSRWESFGIVLTEAMMQGEFAVVSRIPTNEYLTDNYKFALSSEVDDVDSLAGNLLYACTHENEIESLALEGMNVSREKLSLKRCCDVIYDELK